MRPEKRREMTFGSRMRGALSACAAELLVALAFWHASLFMLADVFPDWRAANAMVWRADVILAGLVFLFAAAGQLDGRPRWLCRLCLDGALLTAGLFRLREGKEDIRAGTEAALGAYAALLNKHLKTNFPVLQGEADKAAAAVFFWLFAVTVFFTAVSLSVGVRLFLPLPPFLVLYAELSVGFAPKTLGLTALFAGVLMLYAGGRGRKRKRMLTCVSAADGGPSAGRRLAAGFRVGVLALTLMLLSMFFFMGTSKKLLASAPAARSFQKKTEQRIKSLSAGIFLISQEFVDNQTPQYTGKEMLKVTSQEAPLGNLYLKGFYGTEYRGGRWVCEKQAFKEACKAAGADYDTASKMLLREGYDFWTGGSSGADSSEMAAGRLTVEYSGVRDRFAYLPYFSDPAGDGDSVGISGDGTAKRSRMQKRISVRAWTGAPEWYTLQNSDAGMTGNAGLSWYEAFAEEAYCSVPAEIPAVGKYLNPYESILPEGAYDSEASEPDLRVRMSYAQNLLALAEWARDSGNGADYYDKNVVRCLMADGVRQLLEECMEYSLELPAVDDGTDAVEYFLMESRKGYCTHFASAGALLLRALGIPARYASGYIVKLGEFVRTEDGYEASVKDNNAHAWAEIYLDGVGWTPFEMTPGYLDTSSDLPTRSHTSSTEYYAGQAQGQPSGAPQQPQGRADGEEAQQPEETAPQQPQETTFWDGLFGIFGGGSGAGGYAGSGAWRFWRYAVCVAAVFAAAMTVFALARRVYYGALRRELRDGRYSLAVRRINGRIYRKLCRRGKVLRRHMKDAEYGALLVKTYSFAPAEAWQRYMRIVGAAVFSDKEVSAEDARFCYRLYMQTVR